MFVWRIWSEKQQQFIGSRHNEFSFYINEDSVKRAFNNTSKSSWGKNKQLSIKKFELKEVENESLSDLE